MNVRHAPPRGARTRVSVLSMLSSALLLATALPAGATFPFPPSPDDPYDYTALHIENGDCNPLAPGQSQPPGTDLPDGFDCREHWKLSDYRPQPTDPELYDPAVQNNPQELMGVVGPGTNQAWEITTGRPDTVIAVMDSGIQWSDDTRHLVNKFWLNDGELPVPQGAGCAPPAGHPYDCNADGSFDVRDYRGDPRVSDFGDDWNDYIDPGELIRIFSDRTDADGNGYVDDISGWDFFENDNNAYDDARYGHGTGESEDSAGEIELHVSQCPNCMLLEMRVGDSFIADINHWAEAVVYSVDNGASIVQEALGTLNHTAFGQAAADYAYRNGVLIVASQADESAGHHNYPAALNHTMLVNSIKKFERGVQNPRTWLSFNGCTNFGGYSWLTIPSTSCSSDATAQAAGQAGLLYSAARNAVDQGIIQPHPSGRPLSAEEAKQIFRASADDIDFSTPRPPGPPNNFATTLPDSQRFVTTEGWDQITGWGRVNVDRAVRMAATGVIPPEADIVYPRWWQPLPTAGIVKVLGRVAAPRTGGYTYEVQYAAGVQPPRWPQSDEWVSIASGAGRRPREGVLATLDMSEVRAEIEEANASRPAYTPADDPTSRDLPEKDAFRLRIVVSDDLDETPDAIEQRHLFSVPDQQVMASFPRFLAADGAGSPAFEDLNADGVDELIVADGRGFVHAFTSTGREVGGWPVHTMPITLPTSGDNAYTRGQIQTPVYAPTLLGSPTVVDIDGTGSPEVAVTDIEGRLYVWNRLGRLRRGFPVSVDRRFTNEPGCEQVGGPTCDDFTSRDVRDNVNTVDHAFTAMPSAGNLDPSYPGVELVAGSNDGHVYAWHADGSRVRGWPVLLRDPQKVAAVDPFTHKVTYVEGSRVVRGQKKILTTPTLGDVDGDGRLEVAVNVNEQYNEQPNWSRSRTASLEAAGAAVAPGNTRVYLLHADGFRHRATEQQAATPHPHDQAYVDGWPVRIGMLKTDLLPYVGEGSDGAPVLADVDDDGKLELATASIGSPPYLLRADGSSYYGRDPEGRYITMSIEAGEFKGTASDGPSVASLGGGIFARIGGDDVPMSFVMGATGLRRLLDVVLPEQQLGAEDHVNAYDTETGTFVPGFPAQMNDLMFFNTPASADIDGDGRSDVLQASAMYDLRAYGFGGTVPNGWPKFTGGWSVSTPGVGDLDGDGTLEVAMATREGYLFVWEAAGATCGSHEWPKYQHDLWNTGTHGTDARRPSVVRDLHAERHEEHVIVTWTAPGDDAACGRATRYRVLVNRKPYTGAVPEPVPAGEQQMLELNDPGGTIRSVTIQAIDDSGNKGMRKRIAVVAAEM